MDPRVKPKDDGGWGELCGKDSDGGWDVGEFRVRRSVIINRPSPLAAPSIPRAVGGIPTGGKRGSVVSYFTAEKAVGDNSWLEILARICPSRSDSSRALSHAGSVVKAFHFTSRSASDSQAMR